MKWLDRTLVVSPYCFALCLCEKEYQRELASLNILPHLRPSFLMSTHANATTHYFESGEHERCAIVCLGDWTERTGIQIAALLVHEAVHIWRWSMHAYGEDSPSAEFMSYGIQNISQALMESFLDQTNGLPQPKAA